MDPVSNVDQLVLLLRQRLTERARANGAGAAQRARATGEVAASAIESSRALAAIEGIDERQLRRAVLQNILADHFGSHLVNDAQFQQVVGRVAEAIEDEPRATKLLSEVISELKASAR
jgi:hypothetical protein